MNKIFLLLISSLTLVSASFQDTPNRYSIVGKWKSFEGETINIKLNENDKVFFDRSFDNKIVAEGIINIENDFLVITRKDTLLSYKLKYALSRYEQTLVVEKPNSRQAWLLFRVNYY
tara:strand:+ start:537 stop:887 length:351 start_codon:yes stop_codon:yes gene_type:complete